MRNSETSNLVVISIAVAVVSGLAGLALGLSARLGIDGNTFRDWAPVAQALATVVGFVYVAKQVRAAAMTQVYGRMQDIHGKLLDRPCLRKYFYDGAALPTDTEEQVRVIQTAEMFADCFAQVLGTSQHLDDKIAAGWSTYMKHICANSPALRTFFSKHASWYPSQAMRELIEVCNGATGTTR